MSKAIAADDLKEQLKVLLRKGLEEKDWPDAHLDLLASLRVGLEVWATGILFPQSRPTYFVAEAMDDPERVSEIHSLSQLLVIHSTDNYSISEHGRRVSPVPEETVLLPTKANNVTVIQCDNDSKSVELTLELAESPEEVMLGASGVPKEFDLFCASQDAEGLNAFLTLGQGRWPKHFAFPDGSREPFPRFHLRPVWTGRNGGAPGTPIEVLNVIRHQLDERFLRLPIASLIKADRSGTSSLKIRVRVGEHAARISKLLNGRLKLNHVLFWDRLIGIVDRAEYLEYSNIPASDGTQTEVEVTIPSDPGESICLILECWDRGTGIVYSDSRWSSWLDPAKCFTVRSSERSSMALRFVGSIPKSLVIAYLLTVPLADGIVSKDVVINREHQPLLRVVATPLIEPEGERCVRDSNLLSVWLSGGRSELPTGSIVTRSELVKMVWRLMPRPVLDVVAIKDELTDSTISRRPELHVSTLMRAVSSGDKGNMAYYNHAVPVTVVNVPVRKGTDLEELRYYFEWLARTLEERCILGTVLEINGIET